MCRRKLATVRLLSPTLVVVLAGSAASAFEDKCTKNSGTALRFDAPGRIVAAPPVTLDVGMPVEVTVEEDMPRVHDQVLAVLGRHLESLRGIKKILDKWPYPYPYLLLGVDKLDFQQVQLRLCSAAQTLVESKRPHPASEPAEYRLTGGERTRYTSLLSDSGCPGVARGDGLTIPFPSFAADSEVLSVHAACLDDNGGRLPKTTLPLTTYCPSAKPNEPGFFVDQLPPVPTGCAQETYELRVDDPFVAGVRDFVRDHPMPAEVRSAIDTARLKILEGTSPSPDTLLKDLAPLRECLADEKTTDWRVAVTNCPQVAAKPKTPGGKLTEADVVAAVSIKTAAIEGATADIQLALLELGAKPKVANWVAQWLWLTAGQPQLDPFRSNVAASRENLKARKADLAAVDGRLESLQSFAVQVRTPAAVTELMTTLGSLRVQRDLIKDQIAELEKDMADQSAPWVHDLLLYRGLLFPSTPGGALVGHHDHGLFGATMVALMQHHDAAAQYTVMGAGPVREVRETERVFVLVENELLDTPLKIEVTVTPIKLDLTPFSEQAALSAEHSRAIVKAPSWTAAREAFLKKYDELEALYRLAVEQVRAPVAWQAVADDTPDLTTRNIAYEAPAIAPATVAYTITRGKGESAETVWKGQYRLNKLYWLRLRSGLTFSRLERSGFTAKETGGFTEKRGRYGADGTFGAQFYPFGKRDIRNPTREERGWPVAYVGFSMKAPLSNLYLGAGWEPIAGVTAIVGKHVGRGQRLENEAVRDVWPSDWFTSVIFDVDFFKRLFSLKLEL
jgi:hypothetical protein